jgi:hypothetical protein
VARSKKPDPEEILETTAEDTAKVQTDDEVTAQEPQDAVTDAEAIVPEPPAEDRREAMPNLEPLPAPSRRSGGFFGMVLGGAVAAGLGFGASLYLLPEGWKAGQPSEAEAAINQAIAAQTQDIATLRSELDGVRQATASAETLAQQIEALRADVGANAAAASQQAETLKADLDSAGGRMDAFDQRLTELEKRPVQGGAASASALEAFGREMSDMRRLLDEQRSAATASQDQIAAAADAAAARIKAAEAEAARLQTEAESAAKRATARAALSHVQAALESGTSMESALADLTAAGVEVPAALTEQAVGVPSMAALKSSFPTAARASLAAALKAESDGNGLGRLGAFLRAQTGARSLAPRAGDDADAVLSRSEAALIAGDLAAAVAELDALPEAGRPAMSEWLALAAKRQSAAEAVSALAAQLN